mmetsp:Transcript_68/g.139  ORF Transcript_68/g.139 Transcript_68/m.139 type:complete len:224 (+) Transcript_68:1473-2144(+)
MVHQNFVQSLGQVFSSTSRSNLAVQNVRLKELRFSLQCFSNGQVHLDVFLATQHDTDVTQAKRNHLSKQKIEGIGTFIHNIDLCNDTKSSHSLRVNLFGKTEGIGGSDISITSTNSKNHSVFLGNVLHQHFANLVLDVRRLVTNGNTSHTRKIDQGEIQNVGRKNLQVDRDTGDSFTFSHHTSGFVVNFISNLSEIRIQLLRFVQKFSPFLISSLSFGGVDTL